MPDYSKVLAEVDHDPFSDFITTLCCPSCYTPNVAERLMTAQSLDRTHIALEHGCGYWFIAGPVIAAAVLHSYRNG